MNYGVAALLWKINSLKDELTKTKYYCICQGVLLLAIRCRGEIGAWIAFVAVILQLFFPQHFRGIVSVSKYAFFLSATQYAG